MIRSAKIALSVFIALFGLIYAVQNIVNLQAAYGFVGLMTSMADHVAYPNHVGPPVTAPALVWIMLWIIILAEILIGLLAAKGALDLWQARAADAETFNNAKTLTLAACGLGVLLYFGVFGVFGGAYFQMWQTAAGAGPFEHAAMFSIQFAAFFALVSLEDE